MTVEVAAMTGAATAALLAGLILARPRFQAASGATGKILVLGPLCEAVALAEFAAEHFTAARALAPIVPHWLPFPLFWVYFFGVALLAAAVSFLLGRCLRWSAPLLALFFFLVVATVDLPNLAVEFHSRFFWILACRETCFGSGALVLAAASWPAGSGPRIALARIGRTIVAAIIVFYAVEHFLHPLHVPGVPLEKLTPAWVPAPVLLAWFIGITLLLGGIGLFLRPHIAAASAGTVLLLLTASFYLSILIAEFRTHPVDGLNYFGDTLLFASTVLLAGLAPDTQPALIPRPPIQADSHTEPLFVP